MIKAIKLENFQNHKESLLEFSPGVNVITGSSDQGKSAVIRALSWLATNRPQGTEFIRKGEKDGNTARVSVDVGTAVVVRTRNNSVNDYSIHSSMPAKRKEKRKAAQVFTALKGNVPTEIQEALNFEEFTIQKQLDRHFLLSESPGEVARLLNVRIPGLAKIDPTLASINKTCRTLKEEEKTILAAYTAKQAVHAAMPDPEKLKEAVQKVEVLDGRIRLGKERADSLRFMCVDCVKYENKIKEYRDLEKQEQLLQNLFLFLEKSIAVGKKKDRLLDLCQKAISIQEELSELKADIPNIEKRITDLFSLNGSITGSAREIEVIKNTIATLKRTKAKIKEIADNILTSEKVVKKNLASITVCPLCDSIIGGAS